MSWSAITACFRWYGNARYDIVHVGGASLGLAAMIVVELVSTVGR